MTPFLNPFARNFLCPHVSLVTVSSPIVLVLIDLEVTKYLNRHYPLQYTVSGNNGLADNKSHICHFRMQVTDILDVPSQHVDLTPMLCRQ